MNADHDAVLDAIAELVEIAPATVIPLLADALVSMHAGDWQAIEAVASRVVAAPHYRALVNAFITTWRVSAPAWSPGSIALAIQSAARARERQRRAQTLELVWTGPGSGIPLRRTAQVVREVIDAARQHLLIVSFAVYDIPEIVQALRYAAQRGVQIQLVVESPRASAGKIAYDSLAAFGESVIARAQIYCWPADQRPTDGNGQHGSLHAKCAIADSQMMLLSSANLTRYALDLNMELGVLIRGGVLPGQVAAHVQQLIDQRILSSIA